MHARIHACMQARTHARTRALNVNKTPQNATLSTKMLPCVAYREAKV